MYRSELKFNRFWSTTSWKFYVGAFKHNEVNSKWFLPFFGVSCGQEVPTMTLSQPQIFYDIYNYCFQLAGMGMWIVNGSVKRWQHRWKRDWLEGCEWITASCFAFGIQSQLLHSDGKWEKKEARKDVSKGHKLTDWKFSP